MSATQAPRRIAYTGHFDVPGLLARCRSGDAPANHAHALPALESAGLQVQGIDLGPRTAAAGLRSQWAVLRQLHRADVVVAHAHHDARWLALARRAGLLRVPLCAFVHSHNVRPWHPLHLAGFDQLWPISALARQRLLANGVPASRLHDFAYGPDLQFYGDALAPPPADAIVLSVGVSGRDQATLIDAAPLLQAPLHVVGRVDASDMARATAAGVTIHSSGQYDLSNADLRALYVRAACVVVSHHGSEHPFGITAVAEALAFGRPVVATASPAVDLRVQTIGAGTEVPAHDARALAAAVNALLSDPAGARRLGLAGRLFCAQSCNVQTGADMLAEALAALPGVGRAS